MSDEIPELPQRFAARDPIPPWVLRVSGGRAEFLASVCVSRDPAGEILVETEERIAQSAFILLIAEGGDLRAIGAPTRWVPQYAVDFVGFLPRFGAEIGSQDYPHVYVIAAGEPLPEIPGVTVPRIFRGFAIDLHGPANERHN